MQVATNVQPMANDTILKIVSNLLVVYSKLFMFVYLCLK
jgi:hypothetical protein